MSIDGDLQKHTLNLRTGDFAYIESIFRPKGVPTSLAIRTIIANFVDERRAQESKPDPINLKMEL
jgi:hypothetical protein